MATLNYTIDDAKVDDFITDYCYAHKNEEEIDDPAYTPTGEPNEVIPQIPKYTDTQWVKEHIRRYAVNQVKRGRERKAKDLINTNDPDGDII